MDLPRLAWMKRHLFTKIPEPEVDLMGQTWLITGGNSGIGLELVKHVLRRNASRVIIASRDPQKCKAAVEQCHQELPDFRGQIDCMELDLASFASVRSFSDKVNKEVAVLSVAVMCAGLQVNKFQKTKDGYETTLQVNVISTALLSVLLLPKLQASAIPARKPSLTIVASDVHYWAEWPKAESNIIETLNTPESFVGKLPRYFQSKLANVLFTRNIAALPIAQKLNVCSVNPGLTRSNLARETPAPLRGIANRIAWRPEFSALNLLHASTQETKPGAFFSWGEESLPSKWSVSPEGGKAQEQLWKELQILMRQIAPEVSTILD